MADGGAEVDDAAVALDSDWGHHAVCERCGSENLQPTAYGELVCLDCGTQSQDVRQMVTEEAEEDLERRAVQATHRIRQQPRDKGPRRATVHDVFNSFDLLLAFQTLLESMVVALVDRCDCPAQLHAVVGAIWQRYLSRWSHAGAPLAYLVHQAPHMPPGRTYYSRLAADGFARPPGIVPLSMELLLAACYAGCRWLSVPLLPADISTYVHNGTLPFFHAFQSLPASLRVTNAAAHRLFTPGRLCEPCQLERLAAALAYNVGVTPLPIANAGALLVRVTSLLRLPAGVLAAANQLLALDEHDRLFAAAYCSKGRNAARSRRRDGGVTAVAAEKTSRASTSAASAAASAAGGAVGGVKRKRPGRTAAGAGASSEDSDDGVDSSGDDDVSRAGRKLDANVTYQSDSDAGVGADGRHPPRKRRRLAGLADAGPAADAVKFFGLPGDRDASSLDLLARLRKRCDYGDGGGPYVAGLLAVAMQLTPGWTTWVRTHCRAHMDDGVRAPELLWAAKSSSSLAALTASTSGLVAVGAATALSAASPDAGLRSESSACSRQLPLGAQSASLALADTPMPWTPSQLAALPPGSIRSYADFVAAKVLRGGMSLSLGDGAHHFDSFRGTLMSYSDPAVTLTAAVSDATVTDAIAARQHEAALASGALVPVATGPTVSEDDVLVSMLSVPPLLSQDSDAGDDALAASQASVGGPRAGSSVDGGSRRSTPASSVTGASSAGGSRGRGGLALQSHTLEVALPSRRQQPGADRQEEGGLWPVSQLPAVVEASAAIAGIADVVDAIAPPTTRLAPPGAPAAPTGAALPSEGSSADAAAAPASDASSTAIATTARTGFEPFMVMLSRLHIDASSLHLAPEHVPLDHVPVELAALLRALAAHVSCPVVVILDHVLVLQALLQSYTPLPPRAARGRGRELRGERLAVAAVAGLPVTAGELGLTRVPPDTPVRVAEAAQVSVPSLNKALAAADVKYAAREAERQRKSLAALTTPAGGKAAAAAVAAAAARSAPAEGSETHSAAADLLVAMRAARR